MFKYTDEIIFNSNSSSGQIFNQIKQNETVLELGCGTGQLAKALTEKLNAKVCAVELSQYAMNEALPFLDVGILANADELEWVSSFKDRQFDVVICGDILEHLKKPKEVLSAAVSLLKEDGRVIFSVPNVAHADVIARLLVNHFDYTPMGLLDDTHIYFFAKENISTFFAECGLEIATLNSTYVPIGSSEQGQSNLNSDVLAFLSSKEDANSYQFTGVAYKKEYARSHNIKTEYNTATESMGKLYFDEGGGFSENNTLLFPIKSNIIDIELNLKKSTKSLRFDPVEISGFIINDVSFLANGNPIAPISVTNMLNLNDAYIVTENDPHFIFELSNAETFKIKASISPILSAELGAKLLYNILSDFKRTTMNEIKERDSALSVTADAVSKQAELILSLSKEKDSAKEEYHNVKEQLNQTAQELETLNNRLVEAKANIEVLSSENEKKTSALQWVTSELETYKEHYCMAIHQRNTLSARVSELERMYSCIAGSASWKITKPLRFTLDTLKKIFRKIPPFRLMYKFLKCLKQNGLRYTIRKIKGKFRHNKIATQNILTEEQIKEQQSIVFERDIKFSILVPLYNTPDNLLREMIESVTAQTYSNWELCLADGSDDKHSYVEETAMIYSSIDPRVKYMRLEQNLGISENTNNCEKMATGDFICLLDHDDLIAPNALFENAKAINETGADVLYSDEDHLSMNGLHVNPFYKPDYSPDLLRSQMYICHFLVINRSLFESIGGFRKEYDGSQDYDLMLRLSEQTEKICHIPKILYTWRECEGSTAANADAKPYAHTAGLNALDSHLKRVYGDGAYASESEYTFVFDARYSIMKDDPKVSIIIPMKDKHELTDACIKSILEKSTYQNYEIIILDNRSSNKKTFDWFKEIVKTDERISVHVADMEFNWSKINNYGISLATGDVYIFLNNDIEVITPDWIERLCENALRDDIGVVGPLLLYEDDTIQHAGVVVGLGGWADHVFKGMKPIHYGAPYVSPMVSRNVLAVTGACLAVSKKTIEKIGSFDESFIICGSDIELGIRAYENGLNNKYVSTVRLYHYESKSRDSYIPEQDFKRSYEAYTPYRENVDPYYNINLDINSVLPLESVADMSKCNFKNFLKRCPLTAPICKAIKRAIMPPAEYEIPEILGITPRVDSKDDGKIRINLLTPSVDSKHVFGGISTAMKYFESLRRELGCNARMITTDAPVEKTTSVAPNEYEIISCDDDSSVNLQLVSFSSRYNKSIPVRENDIFVATGWWTAYTIKDVINWQANHFNNKALPLIYMIQDYEPGFYPWSSRYMMADSTYRLKTPIYAVINSHLLREFLDKNGYKFDCAWDFEPVLNDNLRAFLPTDKKEVEKKKQILVYGRPTTDRNAFALLIAGIKKWREKFEGAEEWTVLSAGEAHDDIDLGGGVYIRSCGKLTLEEYANTMLDTYAGVSLMVSPHPSYPPLEMSTFGVKTITNTYSNKDLSNFNDNIISLKSCSADDIGEALTKICETYTGVGTPLTNTDYARGGEPFGNCVVEMSTQIKAIFN